MAAVAGCHIGFNVEVTQLPQTVAAFHSLVGIAATMTSIAGFMTCGHPDGLHNLACFFGSVIGAITFTGSIAAFMKLSGNKALKNVDLPDSIWINRGLCALNTACLYAVMTGGYGLGLTGLVTSSIVSFLLGWNITNKIGSADMPVAITVLNSYSGWALCAEGFILANPMLTIVGS